MPMVDLWLGDRLGVRPSLDSATTMFLQNKYVQVGTKSTVGLSSLLPPSQFCTFLSPCFYTHTHTYTTPQAFMLKMHPLVFSPLNSLSKSQTNGMRAGLSDTC